MAPTTIHFYKTSHNKANKSPFAQIRCCLVDTWAEGGQDVALTGLSPLVLSHFFSVHGKLLPPDPSSARMHTSNSQSVSQSTSQLGQTWSPELKGAFRNLRAEFRSIKARVPRLIPRSTLKPLRRTEFSSRWVRAVSLTAVTPSIIRQWIRFTRQGIFSVPRALE